ncbi:glycosyltransferase family 9 protein [Pelobacter propionicus]|uniref:Glycosyl transferase, family 9 n=1 Tax=Pelobacter propionicus (strain DSM 2379 / NBRC 103807 / OttBd1) TaxID=338966 RepID=A1AUG3_PELPD|nr:glycosyltransferase family 9 protein [Pelobacter propionicus]ABL00984.1 glycosyl transferase, family 9 [Pelobacter propionicus DSM 2379]
MSDIDFIQKLPFYLRMLNKFTFAVTSAYRSLLSFGFQQMMIVACKVANTRYRLQSESIDSIVIVQLANIGDAVLTTPIISALSQKYPHAHIHVITGSENSLVYENNEHVKSTHYINSIKYIRHNHIYEPACNVYNRLRLERFDLTVVVRADLSFITFMLMANNLGKVALYNMDKHPQRRMWLKFLSINNNSFKIKHNVEVINDSLKSVGIYIGETIHHKSEIPIPDSSLSDIFALLLKRSISANFVVFHVNTPFKYRKWPEQRFAELIDYTIDKWGFDCVLIGGKNDAEASKKVLAYCANRRNVISVVGELNLSQTAAIIKLSRLYVGNDSGPMHIAAAAETPVLAFFGPQTPALFHPWKTKSRVLFSSRKCSPCWQKSCVSPENYCMMDIAAHEAQKALDSILTGGNK